MALLLRIRTRTHTVTNPYLLHHPFSTANSGGGDSGDQDPPSSNSPFSSYFKDVKESLKKPQSHSPSNPRSSNFSFSAPSNSQQTSLNEIMKNLSEFRLRTNVPPPNDPSSPQQISFQEIYKRNMLQKRGESTGTADSEPAKLAGGQLSFDAIRGSLQGLSGDRKGTDRMSSQILKDGLRWKPTSNSAVIGGTSPLPESVFGREMRQRKEGDGPSAAMKTEFLRPYEHSELGNKLRELRPEVKGKEWFSLGELNERLMRLREKEKKEAESNAKGVNFQVIRECLTLAQENEDNKPKKTPLHRLDMLGQLGGTPSYLLKPPKEHLVEKYFHPDNMSSAEKLKIELAKVRDEFQMSESDCGSSRVQIAQLTTKIKHLSSVLHKKDVHSRKGLLAMVQKRKRLLKYLRRTDWDSYCFVISKLGLRDNPDYSHKIRSKARSREMAS